MASTDSVVIDEAARRRTFAIISHPDAGKTTLTEKLLLYGGMLSAGAGAVKAREGRRSATSDWMELEQQRGISITSTVLQFEYRDCVLNLLDTPGHKDFSEDTFRVLAAADAAVMVLDAAKGIEPQTRKLFEVCRDQELPILTFINKWDRPGLDMLALLDEVEEVLVLEPAPMTVPVGIAGDFRGVITRPDGEFIKYGRTERGATMATEERLSAGEALEIEGDAWIEAESSVELFDELERNFDRARFLDGDLTPVFFGSALTNFGVGALLDALVDLVPAPRPRKLADGDHRALEAPFSGIVFKIQANMDKNHRDRMAFLRVSSGMFERGMVITHGRTGRPFATKYAHSVNAQDRETIETAFPGDVVGLVNANDFRVGDAVYVDDEADWPDIPSFAPTMFHVARVRDTSRAKQFRSGVQQLDEEGVVQVFREANVGDQAPILGAVGPLQYQVAQHRLENEFGAPVEISPTIWSVCRRTDAASADELLGTRGVAITQRESGEYMALFENVHVLTRIERDQPELVLERLVAEGTLA